ncbi:copper amine oxidase N-terminal domain-containing protein [Cohnella ginsengisoli]|uniref:Copper amine oxidase N-terminal domain-containing protein n=1 Tax=Cohnella ginsengisoli TaxID=425004 RepID=A0A9X4KFM0_9BACL|nr:copper amine oxidase N-terminal domain-containing protein [Cohnella ginsengisoli]MDG0791232.1 copper amine oxidase N-terminal domain-containing protein [Cohnella ginsengisoli]
MVKKLICSLLFICLLLIISPVAEAASTNKPIQLYVNNKHIAGVNPIVKSGIMYVPYRKFFEAMGYGVHYDPDTRKISGIINGAEIAFWAGEDLIEYDDTSYGLDRAIPVINGQVFIPLRQFGNITKYSVYFDQPKLTVSLKSYGYGQEAAIKELVTKYYETFNPNLLTLDHPVRSYSNLDYDYDANQETSEVPVLDYKVTVDRIKYTSSGEATLQVTYVKHTEELNREDIYGYNLRFEHGQWKIAHEGWLYNRMELPVDIDQKAAVIMENDFSEQNAVLSDLNTYYAAYNAEDFERTLEYTAPSFIKDWYDFSLTKETWAENLKEFFSYSDNRFKLTDERVVFLGKKQAIVQGTLSWSDATEDVAEGDDVYEALIYLEHANGRWTYNYDISLDQDFDHRGEIDIFK